MFKFLNSRIKTSVSMLRPISDILRFKPIYFANYEFVLDPHLLSFKNFLKFMQSLLHLHYLLILAERSVLSKIISTDFGRDHNVT